MAVVIAPVSHHERLLALPLAFLLVGSTGCGSDEPVQGSKGGACRVDGVCDAGLFCYKGTCETGLVNPTLHVTAPDLLMAAGIATCSERATLGIHAELYVGGMGPQPCVLAIDPLTLAVDGDCEGLSRGIVRPLRLHYFVVHPNTSERILAAYAISWVDLTDDGLGLSSYPAVAMTGSASSLVVSDADFAALPHEHDACEGILDPPEYNLCRAKVWVADNWPVDFDYDDDGTPNLPEACDGTLYQ